MEGYGNVKRMLREGYGMSYKKHKASWLCHYDPGWGLRNFTGLNCAATLGSWIVKV